MTAEAQVRQSISTITTLCGSSVRRKVRLHDHTPEANRSATATRAPANTWEGRGRVRSTPVVTWLQLTRLRWVPGDRNSKGRRRNLG